MRKMCVVGKTLGWFAALLMVSFVVTGCGSDSNPSMTPDTDPPEITSGPAWIATASTATITWTTDEEATSLVRYGTTVTYGSSAGSGSEGSTTLTTQHAVLIEDLDAATDYHFQVESADASGNPVTSSDYQFTTDLSMSMHLSQGWAEFQSGDYTGAWQSFVDAQTSYPTSADPYWAEGWADLYMGDITASLTAFDAALDINPEISDAMVGRALASCEWGEWDQAIPDAWDVLVAEPYYSFQYNSNIDWMALHAVLGRAHYEREDYGLAQAEVDILFPQNLLDPQAFDYTTELERTIYMLYAQHVYGEEGGGSKLPTDRQ